MVVSLLLAMSNPIPTMKNLPEMVARTKSEVTKLYEQLQRSVCTRELFSDLQAAKLGTPHLESFLRKFFSKKGMSLENELGRAAQLGRDKVIKLCMELQAREVQKEERRAKSRYWKGRLKLELVLGDKIKCKKMVRNIRKNCQEFVNSLREKNSKKVEHYKQKYKREGLKLTEDQYSKLARYGGVKDLQSANKASQETPLPPLEPQATPLTGKAAHHHPPHPHPQIMIKIKAKELN